MSGGGTTRRAGDVAARALRGSAVGLVNVGLGIGTTVATIPLVLRSWNQETYAVWLAVFAAYSLLQTVDTGHATYLGNEFLRLAHTDATGYRRAYASGVRLAMLLGVSQLLVAVAIFALGVAPHVLGIPLAGSAARDAGLSLVALSLGWWVSGSVGGIVAGLYFPSGDFVRAQWWAIANRLLLFGCLVLPAVAGGGVLAAAITTAAGNVFFGVLLLSDAWRRYPIARDWRRDATWGEAVRNARRSIVVTVNNASAQLGTSGTTLAVAMLFGATAVPLFTTVRTLTNAAAAVTTVVVSPIVPDMVRYRVQGEWQKLRASLEVCWLGVGAVVQIGLVSTLSIVEALYTGWTHGRIPFDARLYGVLGWSIAVAAVGSPALRYLQAMNRLSAQTWCNAVYLGTLGVGIALGVSRLGLWGVGAALAAAEIARSVMAVRLVSNEAGSDQARAIARSTVAALLPVCVSGGAIALATELPAHRELVSFFGTVALTPAFALQWRSLDSDLRRRLLTTLLRWGQVRPK